MPVPKLLCASTPLRSTCTQVLLLNLVLYKIFQKDKEPPTYEVHFSDIATYFQNQLNTRILQLKVHNFCPPSCSDAPILEQFFHHIPTIHYVLHRTISNLLFPMVPEVRHLQGHFCLHLIKNRNDQFCLRVLLS